MFDNEVYNDILNNKNIKNISNYIIDNKNYSFENLKYFDYIEYNSKVNLNKNINKKNFFLRNSNDNNNNKFNKTTNISIDNNNNKNIIFKKTHILSKPKLINKNFNKYSLFNLKKNTLNNSSNFSLISNSNKNNNNFKNLTFDIKNSTKNIKTKTKIPEIKNKILTLKLLNQSEISENNINNNNNNNKTNSTISNSNFSLKCDNIINKCKSHINKINLKQSLNQIDPYQLRKLENKYKSIKCSNNKNEDAIFEEKNKKINLYLEDINEIRTDKKYYKKTLKKCFLMKKQFLGINNLDNKFAFKTKNFCNEIFGVEKSEFEKNKENENKIKMFRERNKKKIKEMNDLIEKNEKRYFKIHNMFDNIIKKQKIEKEKIEKFLKLKNNNNY